MCYHQPDYILVQLLTFEAINLCLVIVSWVK